MNQLVENGKISLSRSEKSRRPDLIVTCSEGKIIEFDIPDETQLTFGEVSLLLGRVGIELDSVDGVPTNVQLDKYRLNPGKRSLADGTLKHVAMRIDGSLKNVLYLDSLMS